MDKKIRKYLLILILISFLIRAMAAWLIELGNDEVYYRLYALYPDWSHFDHPPMVGWIIQLFSLNLTLHSEFFLRLGFVVTGTFSTWIIFLIGKEISDDLTGLYAAILYTSSIYCSIIAGIFIMPDGPQV
ncbi:MAG: ArnT family glycosyltransferase, partial [Syntrophothermus sp.]